MSPEQVREAINKIDLSGDGEIEYDEFLQLMTEEMKEKMTDEELIEAFKFFGPKNDRDGISKAQLKETLDSVGEKLNDADLDLLFEETSISGNGQITFSDFMLMMMAK